MFRSILLIYALGMLLLLSCNQNNNPIMLTDPSGKPSIKFEYVPPLESHENLTGSVWNVWPNEYQVAVYIRVGNGWWTKPYLDQLLTPIKNDCTWACDITTGGVDQAATKIVAYLVPLGYTPPKMNGGGTLPNELEEFPKAERTRP